MASDFPLIPRWLAPLEAPASSWPAAEQGSTRLDNYGRQFIFMEGEWRLVGGPEPCHHCGKQPYIPLEAQADA